MTSTHAPAPASRATTQPFKYPLERKFVEPDWNRIPGFKGVSKQEWESAVWQRKHTVKNLRELKERLGALLPENLAASIEKDQQTTATMSVLITPHMINT